jgi:DnaK suppressor protein
MFGDWGALLVQFLITAVVVLGLVAVVFWLVRRYSAAGLGRIGRGRVPRLAIIDAMSIDGRRRLVLVRRDNVEHLILIGGPTDVVVEQTIQRARRAKAAGSEIDSPPRFPPRKPAPRRPTRQPRSLRRDFIRLDRRTAPMAGSSAERPFSFRRSSPPAARKPAVARVPRRGEERPSPLHRRASSTCSARRGSNRQERRFSRWTTANRCSPNCRPRTCHPSPTTSLRRPPRTAATRASRVSISTTKGPEPFMNDRQKEYFRASSSPGRRRSCGKPRDAAAPAGRKPALADVADRASNETDRSLELRTRDRQRKLIAKIDAALQRIDEGTYGYCEETGEPISLRRLDARPIATLSIEAQERHERRERVYRDD